MSLFTVSAAGAPVLAGDTLLVLAQDGSLLAFDKQSGVDLVGPEIKMAYPAAGSQVNGADLAVVFKLTDLASGLNETTVNVTVNKQKLDFELDPDGTATAYFTESGKNKPLQDGRADFIVSGEDWMGNKTELHFALMIDNTLRPTGPPAGVVPPPGRGGFPPGRGGGGGGGIGGGGFGGGGGR